ncbi:GNAT family N-acetyltransferase [Candidatus Latescibacterota bacterium]
MTRICIKQPGQREAGQLAFMLCRDHALRRDLGIAADVRPTAEGFLEHLAVWCESRRATTYAILADDVAVGTISLSHRRLDGLSARIGYWVGSDHRRRGYATEAFAAVLARAASEGIRTVSATIDTGNIASRRLWERLGAAATEVSAQRVRYELSAGPGLLTAAADGTGT